MIETLFGSAPSKEPSLLERLKAGVQKTRAGLMEKLEDAVSGRKEIDSSVLEELEYALITADIGMKKDDLERAARIAVQAPYPNPRKVEYQPVLELLHNAYEGKKP